MASVWGELKRRNVVKVAVAYAIVGWLVIEIASVLGPALNLPDWTTSFVAFLLILGFPVALVLSWAYELTPEGMKKTKSVPLSESITHITGRKLDFVIIGLLAIAVVFMFVDNYLPESGPFAGAEIDPASLGPTLEEAPPIAAEDPTAGAINRRSIAALPFMNDSAAEEDAAFLADGIHDELLTRLAKIGSLKVISRTSMLEYRDSPKNMREIGRELGVATLLEGRVQRAGNMVRINVQLIDAETDAHIWSEIYNDELTAENVFAIQSEIATSIAEALQVTLLPGEVERLAEVPTQSTRAWEFYLSGKTYADQPDELTFMPLAIQQYERALGEDPNFALAWAALSSAHGELSWNSRIDSTQSRAQLALDAVEKAFEIAPDSPEAHLAMARYHYFVRGDYDSALEELDIAEQGMPGSAEIFSTRSGIFRRADRWQESVEARNLAIELDPRNVDLIVQGAATHVFLRQYEQAEQLLDRALEVEPDNAVVFRWRAQIPLFQDGDVSLLKTAAEDPPIDLGRFRGEMGWTAAAYEGNYESALAYLDGWDIDFFQEEGYYIPKALYYGVTYELAERRGEAEAQFQTARAQIEEALAISPDSPFLQATLGIALAGLSDNDAAIAAAYRAMELAPRSRDGLLGAVAHIEAIKVFLAAEQYGSAIEELDAYLGDEGEWSIHGILRDPHVAPIRDDPRFQAVVEKYSQP